MKKGHTERAWELAEEICRDKRYSTETLKQKARIYDLGDEIGIGIPSDIKPDGLRNDMKTLPRILFVYSTDTGKIKEQPAAAELL